MKGKAKSLPLLLLMRAANASSILDNRESIFIKPDVSPPNVVWHFARFSVM